MLAVPVAMAGDVMGHASSIVSLLNEELHLVLYEAIMESLPVNTPMHRLAAKSRGLWVIRLHQVPTGSPLQVDAILQEKGKAIKPCYC